MAGNAEREASVPHSIQRCFASVSSESFNFISSHIKTYHKKGIRIGVSAWEAKTGSQMVQVPITIRRIRVKAE
jgi:hypothetical protein